jgi:hypothetical protein
MRDHVDAPPEVIERLRSICGRLPETHEERAWVGTRWRIRTRTFAHVLLIDDGWPPVYARESGTDGPATVLMFRSSGQELDALRHLGRPFFAPVWRADEVGMVLGEDVDWDEVDELVTESYCLLAPAALRAKVERPGD